MKTTTAGHTADALIDLDVSELDKVAGGFLPLEALRNLSNELENRDTLGNFPFDSLC